MNPTREQLELAAKAAGIKGWWSGSCYCYGYNGNQNVPIPWQPWEHKPDSFDLMVACRIEPEFFDNCVTATALGVMWDEWLKDHNNDKGLATMWAVFLCAVEIGRASVCVVDKDSK